MTTNKARKSAIRAHARETGQSYTAAMRAKDAADSSGGWFNPRPLSEIWNEPLTVDHPTLGALIDDLEFLTAMTGAPFVPLDSALLASAARTVVAVWDEGDALDENPSPERQAARLGWSLNELYGDDFGDEFNEPLDEDLIAEMEEPSGFGILRTWAANTEAGETLVSSSVVDSVVEPMLAGLLHRCRPDFAAHEGPHGRCAAHCQAWHDVHELLQRLQG